MAIEGSYSCGSPDGVLLNRQRKGLDAMKPLPELPTEMTAGLPAPPGNDKSATGSSSVVSWALGLIIAGFAVIASIAFAPGITVVLLVTLIVGIVISRRPLHLGILSAVVVCPFVVRDCTAERRRPIFYHDYRRGDLTPLRYWMPPPPITDAIGNLILLDRKLNLVVVVVAPMQEKDRYENQPFWSPAWHSAMYEGGPGGTCVRVPLDLDQRVPIARVTDQLLVILPDGNLLRASLRPGAADRVDSLVGSGGQRDMKSFLTQGDELLEKANTEGRDLLRTASEWAVLK